MRGVFSSPAFNEGRVMDKHEHETQARTDEGGDVRLYTVASTIAEYDGHKDVVFNWFVKQHREPLYPFTDGLPMRGFELPRRLAGELVDLPDAYTPEDFWCSECALNRMFTLDEAEMLAEYLRGRGDDPAIHEEELPVECGRLDPLGIPTGGPQDHYRLDRTPGYPLNFEVWGYYDLRHAEGPYSDEVALYAPPAPYAGEFKDLLNDLGDELQPIAYALGVEHPLYRLVDDAFENRRH